MTIHELLYPAMNEYSYWSYRFAKCAVMPFNTYSGISDGRYSYVDYQLACKAGIIFG